MKKDYMYKYPSNVVYYSNYPYMDRNSNYNSNDERFAGGTFIGLFHTDDGRLNNRGSSF